MAAALAEVVRRPVGSRDRSRRMRTYCAPGRVNLIGEYTDLAGGLVLPAALELGVTIGARPAEDDPPTSRTTGPARCASRRTACRPARHAAGWGRYVAAVAAELAELGRPPVGIEGEVSSTLPIGTGLSSSAALEVAVAVALCAVADSSSPRSTWRARRSAPS